MENRKKQKLSLLQLWAQSYAVFFFLYGRECVGFHLFIDL